MDQGPVNGDSPVRHRGDTWPPLSRLGAGGPTLAAVISPRKPTLHASQVRLSFNICAPIVFKFLFTGPHAHAPPPPLRVVLTLQNDRWSRPAAGGISTLSASRSGARLSHPILYVGAATSDFRENSRFPLGSPPRRVLPGSPADRLVPFPAVCPYG